MTDPAIKPELIKQHGLTPDEFLRAKEILPSLAAACAREGKSFADLISHSATLRPMRQTHTRTNNPVHY